MNEPEMNTPAVADLGQQVEALQHQVFMLLLALIVVSGTLVAYLGYESHHIGKEVDSIKPQAVPLIQAFKQNQPALQNFVNQLVAYGQTHPDFRPVLQKYGINPMAPPPTTPKK